MSKTYKDREKYLRKQNDLPDEDVELKPKARRKEKGRKKSNPRQQIEELFDEDFVSPFM